MARRQSLGVFCFVPENAPEAPSLIEERIRRLQIGASLLSGVLLASLVANVAFAWIAERRADVEPYVADGGVWGCQVRSFGAGTPQ